MTAKQYVSAKEIAKHLQAHQSFVICGHVGPDGDCVGSQLALMHGLRLLGKQAICLLAKPDSVDKNLHYLPGVHEMVPIEDYQGQAEVVVAVDVPTSKRIGEEVAMLFDRAELTLAIDHHQADEPLAHYTYLDSGAASSTMLVWEVLAMLGAISSDVATCTYTGLATDTGRFQFQNTNAACFQAAQMMVEAGAQPSVIANHLFQNQSLATLRLEALVVERMQLYAEGKYVLSFLRQDDFKALNARKADADPLINTLRSLEGVHIACMLREDEEGGIRGSLRAKGEGDVEVIARTFGGGGHKAAAGFSLNMPLEQALDEIKCTLNAVFSEA